MLEIYELFNLCDKYAHRIDEQTETIHELQTVLKFRTNENKSLYKEINRLRQVIEIKDNSRIELVKENTRLRKELKNMLNVIYGTGENNANNKIY